MGCRSQVDKALDGFEVLEEVQGVWLPASLCVDSRSRSHNLPCVKACLRASAMGAWQPRRTNSLRLLSLQALWFPQVLLVNLPAGLHPNGGPCRAAVDSKFPSLG